MKFACAFLLLLAFGGTGAAQSCPSCQAPAPGTTIILYGRGYYVPARIIVVAPPPAAIQVQTGGTVRYVQRYGLFGWRSTVVEIRTR